MTGDEALQDIGQVGVRFDLVELAGLDEGGDHRPMLGTDVGAGEESVFAIQGNRPDRALDHVGVELNPAVVQEAQQPGPVLQRVADRLGDA